MSYFSSSTLSTTTTSLPFNQTGAAIDSTSFGNPYFIITAIVITAVVVIAILVHKRMDSGKDAKQFRDYE